MALRAGTVPCVTAVAPPPPVIPEFPAAVVPVMVSLVLLGGVSMAGRRRARRFAV